MPFVSFFKTNYYYERQGTPSFAWGSGEYWDQPSTTRFRRLPRKKLANPFALPFEQNFVMKKISR